MATQEDVVTDSSIEAHRGHSKVFSRAQGTILFAVELGSKLYLTVDLQVGRMKE